MQGDPAKDRPGRMDEVQESATISLMPVNLVQAPDLEPPARRQAPTETPQSEDRLRKQLVRVGNRLKRERQKRAAAEEMVDSTQRELRAVRRDLRAARLQLGDASRVFPKPERAQDRLRHTVKALGELLLHDSPFLDWVLARASVASIGMKVRDRMGCTGTGPYQPKPFNALLERLGISPDPMPDPHVSHVLVGREGWSKDLLDLQVDQRRGSTLRVYSQEMLLAALVTGRDPLEEGGEDLLDAFKSANGALQYLAAEGLFWPGAQVQKEIGPVIGEVDGVEDSPLHAMGYSVEPASPATVSQRREMLRLAFETDQLPWVHSQESWGRPGMPKRLWRIANHLATLIWFQGSGPGKAMVRAHWAADLAWLHETIYHKQQFKFVWPKVPVKPS
jgi:hypothetical protein